MNIAVICDASSQNGKAMCAALRAADHEASIIETGTNMVSALRSLRPQLAFNAVEGPIGANGAIQDILNIMGIPCVGSSSQICQKAFDASKLSGVMESYWAIAGVDLTASWPFGTCISRDAYSDWGMSGALDLLEDYIPGGFPLCVRPARWEGATKVSSQEELKSALDSAFDHCSDVVVQQWVSGVKMDVCIIGNDWDAFVLPPVELVEGERHESYAPVRLESLSPNEEDAQAIRAEIERAALEAYWAFGLRDYASISVVWDGGQARILKVRPFVNMAEGSSFAKACNTAGLSVSAVLNELVNEYV